MGGNDDIIFPSLLPQDLSGFAALKSPLHHHGGGGGLLNKFDSPLFPTTHTPPSLNRARVPAGNPYGGGNAGGPLHMRGLQARFHPMAGLAQPPVRQHTLCFRPQSTNF